MKQDTYKYDYNRKRLHIVFLQKEVNIESVRSLLSESEILRNINEKDDFGKTSLYYACTNDNVSLEIIKLLLENKADPNLDVSDDGSKKNIIYYMSKDLKRDVSVVDLLEKHGKEKIKKNFLDIPKKIKGFFSFFLDDSDKEIARFFCHFSYYLIYRDVPYELVTISDFEEIGTLAHEQKVLKTNFNEEFGKKISPLIRSYEINRKKSGKSLYLPFDFFVCLFNQKFAKELKKPYYQYVILKETRKMKQYGNNALKEYVTNPNLSEKKKDKILKNVDYFSKNLLKMTNEPQKTFENEHLPIENKYLGRYYYTFFTMSVKKHRMNMPKILIAKITDMAVEGETGMQHDSVFRSLMEKKPGL